MSLESIRELRYALLSLWIKELCDTETCYTSNP